MSTEYLNNKAFETIIIKFQQAKRNKQKYKLLKKDYDIQKPVWLIHLHDQFQIYLFFLKPVPMNQPKVDLPFVLLHFLYK